MSNFHKPINCREFHLSEVLSVVTGFVLTNKGMPGIFDVMSHILGYPVGDTNVQDAKSICTPYIFTLYPELEDIDMEGFARDTVDAWIAKKTEKYGEYLSISPL